MCRPGSRVGGVGVFASIEAETAEMDADEARALLEEFGVDEPGLEKVIAACYRALDLITFLTTGEDETRAWEVRRGAAAPEAAGAIHTDLQRGFIRAEVIGYDELVAAGSMEAAKSAGKIRVEGKDYVVRRGRHPPRSVRGLAPGSASRRTRDSLYRYRPMDAYRIGEAAKLIGVRVETLRAWERAGKLTTNRTPGGQRLVPEAEVARLLSERRAERPTPTLTSRRNPFPGVITKVKKDKVSALVEIQAGPHRVVSLITREAADELGLEPGMEAIATVKATSVMVEVPDR